VLFIQGGGDGGHEADAKLAASLQTSLGNEYEIKYPEIQPDEPPDFGWTQQIGKKISEIKGDVILVGHSFGASMILKYLSENSVDKKIDGIFLIAAPFWSGNEEWKTALKLQDNFAEKLLPKHQFSSIIARTMKRYLFHTSTNINKNLARRFFV